MKTQVNTFIFFLAICFLSLASFSAKAQCPPGDLLLLTQAQVDQFAIDYPGCTTIAGYLTIGPSTDIDNLNALSTITQINQSLTIMDNDALTDVSGLSILASVHRSILINNNPLLSTIDLAGVNSTITEDFLVENNAALTAFGAPINLSSVGGNLHIVNNPNLSDLSGLENLTSIGIRMRIINILEDDFPDFSNLVHVGREILINDNPNVTSLNFQNVTGSLGTDFSIRNNAALTTLAAPVNLMTIGGNLIIDLNPNLFNLTGFENVTSIGITLRIARTLEDEFPDFANLTNVGRTIDIARNPNVSYLNFQNVSGALLGSFAISINDALTQVDAPVNVTSLGEDLIFSGNPNLTTLTGLGNVTSIGQHLNFVQNGIVGPLDFSSLTSVGRFIYFTLNPNVTSINIQNVSGTVGIGIAYSHGNGIAIDRNDALTTLVGPEPLTEVDSRLSINHNPNLSSFTGFGNLTNVSGDLFLGALPTSSFPGMLNLTTIGGNLELIANEQITDLNWLANLASIGGDLRIVSNPFLSDCSISAVCSFLAGSGIRHIAGNTGCCFNEPILTNACNDPAIGIDEICDGVDNNCNGYTDEEEGLDCTPPPPNDECFNAILISCDEVVYGNTDYATSDLGLAPVCEDGEGTNPGAPGVWYRIIGHGDDATASLCGSSYDTQITVYSGNCDGLLECVAYNDDSQCGLQSQVTFPTEIGEVYYILVNGYGGESGDFVLSLSCGCNEEANVPAPWSRVDIGNANGFGFANNCDGTICVESYGFNLPNADLTHFLYTSLCGDGSFTARVVSVTNPDGRGGIMFRDNLTPGSPKATLKTQLTYSTVLWRDIRLMQNALQHSKNIPVPGHQWLRLVREGNYFRGYASQTGEVYYFLFSQYIPMETCIDIGMYVESPNVNTLSQACFADISITGDFGGELGLAALPNFQASEETQEQPRLTLFPNPANEELLVDLRSYIGQEGRLNILNSQGQVLQILELGEIQEVTKRLDVRALPVGVYFLQLQTDGDQEVCSFVVAR